MYEDRIERAKENFMSGYNCSQSVTAAFADLLGMDTELALRASSSFGAGIGRMRLTCGAACGLFILAGLLTGCTDPTDRIGKGRNYAIVQQLAEKFREKMGSTTCREILGLRKNAPTPPMPDERTAEYYRKRPCVRTVETAAQIFAEFLSEYNLSAANSTNNTEHKL